MKNINGYEMPTKNVVSDHEANCNREVMEAAAVINNVLTNFKMGHEEFSAFSVRFSRNGTYVTMTTKRSAFIRR